MNYIGKDMKSDIQRILQTDPYMNIVFLRIPPMYL